MASINKKQFVEIDFTGRVKDTGEVFDTTLKENAKSLGIEKVEPLKICVGEGMLLDKFDKSLEGKEVGKEYSLELSSKEAFGERKSNLVQMIPLKVFTEKKVMPYRGLMLNLDGKIVKIVSVSGGRVIADFNNPLSGKTIIYNFKINRVINDKKEQIESLILNILKINPSNLTIEVKDKKAEVHLHLKNDEFNIFKGITKPFSEKVKELIGVDLEFKNESIKEKKE